MNGAEKTTANIFPSRMKKA